MSDASDEVERIRILLDAVKAKVFEHSYEESDMNIEPGFYEATDMIYVPKRSNIPEGTVCMVSYYNLMYLFDGEARSIVLRDIDQTKLKPIKVYRDVSLKGLAEHYGVTETIVNNFLRFRFDDLNKWIISMALSKRKKIERGDHD